jgi:hypothetical protein
LDSETKWPPVGHLGPDIELGLGIGARHFHTELEACQSIRSKDIDRTSSNCQLAQLFLHVDLCDLEN